MLVGSILHLIFSLHYPLESLEIDTMPLLSSSTGLAGWSGDGGGRQAVAYSIVLVLLVVGLGLGVGFPSMVFGEMPLGWILPVRPLGTGRSLLQFIDGLCWSEISNVDASCGSPSNKSGSCLSPSWQLCL
jgi:hypothetical protein